jgi:hypothetical protein
VQLIAPSASPEEAAAIAAALEHFLRDTAPPATAEPPRESAWARVARHEAVARAWSDPTGW